MSGTSVSRTGLPRPNPPHHGGGGTKGRSVCARAALVAINAVGRKAGTSQLQYPKQQQSEVNGGLGTARIGGVRNVDARRPPRLEARAQCLSGASGRCQPPWRRGLELVFRSRRPEGGSGPLSGVSWRVTSLLRGGGCPRPSGAEVENGPLV